MDYIYKDRIRIIGVMDRIQPDSIETLHELSVHFSQTLFNRAGAVNTTWLIINPAMRGTLIAESRWDGDNEKDEIAGFMRWHFKKRGITMYSHIDEAWITEQPANVDISKVPRPSEDPNRQEIVLIDSFSKTEWRCTTFYIERNPGPVLTKRRDAPQSTINTGRLWNLLEERTLQ